LAAAPSDFSRIVVSRPALLPGRRVVVHLAAVAGGVLLPPADALDELLADRARRGAAGEEVLGAVDLGRLDRIEVPPWRTSRSEAAPSAGIGGEAE
jgi:hypothetical protein